MDADLSEKLNAVLSDPERLKGMMSVISSLADKSGPEQITEKTAEAADAIQSFAIPDILPKSDKRGELLRALKPFLSDDKRERIDKILRIMTLAGIAGIFNDDKGAENV